MTEKTYGTMYYVDDMDKAAAFYKGKLGLKPGYESPEWTEFPVGDHKICLHGKSGGETYTPNGVLIVSVTSVKTVFEKMKRDGLNVSGLHEIHPDGWRFLLKDVSGNELSFYGTP